MIPAAEGAQVTTLSCFRFASLSDKLWAFSQMQFARRPLSRLPGISFLKLFGSGSRESFHPYPNFGVYAVMATWPSLESAREQVHTARPYRRYREHARENCTLYLTTSFARGRWDGGEPFIASGDGSTSRGNADAPAPIGVLTRATIRKRRLLEFWNSVPRISDDVARHHAPLFKLGLGEVPWLQQVTFSIWPSFESMREFAYASGPHRDAIKRVRERDWFREDLYARFSIAEVEGGWTGARLH